MLNLTRKEVPDLLQRGRARARCTGLYAAAALVSALTIVGSAGATIDFGATRSYATSGLQVAVTTSDLNGDHSTDIVTASQNADSVSVLLGGGDGTFGAPSQYQVFANPGTNLAGPFDVRIADLDHDDDPDFVTADWRGHNVSGTVSVFIGRGDGTFEAPIKFATGVEPVSLALGDLDRDGHVDAVTANFRVGSVSVLLGRGDGTFREAATLPFSFPFVAAVAVADLNRDGWLDLVAETGSDSVGVSRGNGDGTFSTPIFFPVLSGGFGDVEVADFNDDGAQDVAIPGEFDDVVSVLLGNGDGTLSSASAYATGSGTFPIDIAVADLDSDGALDLTSANANSSDVSVLIGAGDGTFGPALRLMFGQTHSIATGLLDGDGRPDLALGRFGQVTVVLNRTTPVDETPPQIVTPTDITSEATGPDGVLVTYTVTVMDDIDPNPALSCTPPSGHVFSIGTATVTCTATDASGNSASARFAVTVVDTTPPLLVVPERLTAEATTPNGVALSWEANATDIVDGSVPVRCVPPPGSTFAIGTSSVTCTASDAFGNEASASFDVHIKGAAEQLDELIELVEDLGPGTSLADKLESARAALDEGERAEACSSLRAFANEVRAQSGSKLTPAQAEAFMAAANRIRAVLAC
jgi:FG-GAP-like repeat/HYR domain